MRVSFLLALVHSATVIGPSVLAQGSGNVSAGAPKATSFSPQRLVEAARGQIGQTVRYDPAYVSLSYPGGDVPLDRGVCTDVVIRAYRTCAQIDLQERVHTDMAAYFSAYPKNWGSKKTDKNMVSQARTLRVEVGSVAALIVAFAFAARARTRPN